MSFVDCHCDTITTIMEKNESLFKNKCQIDIERLSKFDNPVQFFSIWLHSKYHDIPIQKTLDYIKYYYQQLDINKNYISPVFSYKDILTNKQTNKISAILAIEGLNCVYGVNEFDRLYEYGVRLCTLTWNNKNNIGCGVNDIIDTGLTKLGIEAIEAMNYLGIIIDVSHLSPKGFSQVYKLSSKPFVATHSNAYSICKNKRNLTDEQIKMIAQAGGVIGVNFYPPFVANKSTSANINDIMRHISHIQDVGGSDVLAIGADFDGTDQNIQGIYDVSSLEYVFDEIGRKFGSAVREKIAEKNMLNFLKSNLTE